MSKVDLLLIIPLAWGAIMGFKKGLIQELASIIGLIIGIWGAINFSQLTAKYLNDWFTLSESTTGLIAFILTFILIVVLVILLGKILDKLLKMIALGLVVRIAGMLFGILKYALILSFVLYFYEAVNQNFKLEKSDDWKEKSLLYQPLVFLHQPFGKWLNEFDAPEELKL